MPNKKKIVYNGELIEATENKDYWELQFSDGTEKKLYNHVNAANDAVWMWESGKIDNKSLAIGELIDGMQ